MYQLRTEKQLAFFDEVIRLHYEEGYGENRIAKVLPVGHTTASRWIAIFAREKGKIYREDDMSKPQKPQQSKAAADDSAKLLERIKQVEALLLRAEIKSEAYDEMIRLAEAKFGISIRKKSGAKQ